MLTGKRTANTTEALFKTIFLTSLRDKSCNLQQKNPKTKANKNKIQKYSNVKSGYTGRSPLQFGDENREKCKALL
jgi:hypothetical protein